MKRRISVIAPLLVSALFLTGTGYAAKFNKVLNIGDRAPAWKQLVGIDGKTHSLGDLKDAKAILVVFTGNQCPVAMAYEDRLIAFAEEYKAKGVAVIAINSNLGDADALPKMKERANEKKFNFTYLKDSNQEIGRNYGATVTPHVFLLDQNQRIAYMGAFDDNMIPDKVEEQSTREAVKAVLSDKQPEVTETRQFGCGIQYADK